MTKYLAPTPWSVDLSSEGQKWTDSISIADANGGHVAHLTRGYEGDAENDGCPSWTNARLIAAAPDLLEALRDMVLLFQGYQGMELKRAHAAIAKACG